MLAEEFYQTVMNGVVENLLAPGTTHGIPKSTLETIRQIWVKKLLHKGAIKGKSFPYPEIRRPTIYGWPHFGNEIFLTNSQFKDTSRLAKFDFLNSSRNNDGNISDSEDEANEALFKQPIEGSNIENDNNIVEVERKEIEEQRVSEEVLIDGESSESDEEPDDCDLVLGQYDEVQRTKNKAGRRYKCKIIRAILKLDKKDYIAAKLNAEIEY